jgi:hypothetical protein
MPVKRFFLASILTVLTASPFTASAQQEVAPDHFDGTDAAPQVHSRTKSPRKQDKAASKRRVSSGNRRNHHK